MHRINKEFDKIVCITLAERRDKRNKIQVKFDKLGIEVEWYTAVQYGFVPNLVPVINQSGKGKFNPQQPYEFGAALSHYHVIKQALLEGADSIFVFEDDVLFHKDFNSKFDLYFDSIPKNWDFFLLYSFMYNWLPENERMNAFWARSFKSWSLMTYGMKKDFMEAYINHQNQYFTISDKVTFDMQEYKKWNCYSAVPSICLPDTHLGSNIRGTNLNYAYNPSVTNWGVPNEDYE